MPSKTKKSFWSSLLTSSGVTAAAIVIVCVSLGAIILPNIFADNWSPHVSNLKSVPTNSSNYGFTVSWTGYTDNKYRQKIQDTTWETGKNQLSRTFTSMTCGTNYTVKVAPTTQQNALAADYKSVTAKANCPGVVLDKVTVSGNNVTAIWHSSPWASTYTFYLNGGGTNVGSATSKTVTGSCNTSYSVKILANGQGGTQSSTQTVKTGACPLPPDTGGGGGGSGGGGGGGGSSGGGGGSTTKKKTVTSANTLVSSAPSTPGNFAANVVSSKIVQLSWDASSGADHYIINRSTDGVNWQELANTTASSYDDEEADFSTTYNYQLYAVGGDGKPSGTVSVQATTEAFEASSNKITSQDKLVTVNIPDGAIEGEYDCTLSADEESSSAGPDGQKVVLGPYSLLCVTVDGDVVDTFEKAMTVSMKLASVSDGYADLNAKAATDDGWSNLKGTYREDSGELSFSLTSARSFAAFGKKQHSPVGTILLIFFLLALAAGAVFAYRYFKNRPPRTMAQTSAAQAALTAEQEFKQALAQPDCSHLAMAQQVIPSSQGCYECEQLHTHWNSLRICLICGHVGCSDDSPEQHAQKHYADTGHPLIYEYGNPVGNTIGWCYIDQTYI